jgi:5-methylcytosine-specific restriction enzyme A
MPPRLAQPLKILDNFYTSPAWRKFIAQVIAERGRRCESCGRDYDDDGQAVRLIGDHFRERSDGGADFDPTNIQLLCVRMTANGTGGCANRKTAEARRARMQATTAKG